MLQDKKFQRRVEDFVCENCGHTVRGSGYTNHCPVCLWSKHVDVNPGDRARECGGLMEPIAVEGASPQYTIVHRCRKCKLFSRNKADPDDDPRALIEIAKNRNRGMLEA